VEHGHGRTVRSSSSSSTCSSPSSLQRVLDCDGSHTRGRGESDRPGGGLETTEIVWPRSPSACPSAGRWPVDVESSCVSSSRWCESVERVDSHAGSRGLHVWAPASHRTARGREAKQASTRGDAAGPTVAHRSSCSLARSALLCSALLCAPSPVGVSPVHSTVTSASTAMGNYAFAATVVGLLAGTGEVPGVATNSLTTVSFRVTSFNPGVNNNQPSVQVKISCVPDQAKATPSDVTVSRRQVENIRMEH
jgi:hypothetical protein